MNHRSEFRGHPIPGIPMSQQDEGLLSVDMVRNRNIDNLLRKGTQSQEYEWSYELKEKAPKYLVLGSLTLNGTWTYLS